LESDDQRPRRRPSVAVTSAADDNDDNDDSKLVVFKIDNADFDLAVSASVRDFDLAEDVVESEVGGKG